MLKAFCPPPFQNADQERYNLICPVQALDAYVHRAALWRKSDQLFVCLDLLTRGPLHLSKGWTSGWLRPSHLVMSRPVNLLLWLSGPTRPGVWRPPRPWYQEFLSKRFVMWQAGPHRTHSSDFILWTWTLPQVPKCSRTSAARLISQRTGTRRYGDVVLTIPIAFLTQRSSLERESSVTTVTSVPWRGNKHYVPRPYLLRACKRLFKLVTASFGQAL